MLEFAPHDLFELEENLDPGHPDRGDHRATVIGYGEMSCVLHVDPYDDLVFKRLSGFESFEQMHAYREVIQDYCKLLRKAGIDPVETGFAEVKTQGGGFTLYLVQPRVPAEELGNNRLNESDDDALHRLVHDTLEALNRLWTRNAEKGPAELIGLDGQISNWAYAREDNGFALTYFDVGTPFIRRDGREQLNGEVHMKAMPFFLRPIVRYLFLKDVMDRYYDFRGVLIDFVGNFHKEGHAAKIDAALEQINAYLAKEAAHLDIEPLTREEIDKYYKEDKFIWTIFLAFRRFDRFLTAKILRRRYNYILPGRIKR